MKRRRIIRSNCRTWIRRRRSSSITRIIKAMLMALGAMTMARRLEEGGPHLSTKEARIRMRVVGRTSWRIWAIQLARLKERQKIPVRAQLRRRARLPEVVLLAPLLHQAPKRCQLWTVWSKYSKYSSKLGAECKPSTQEDQERAQSATQREPSPSQSSSRWRKSDPDSLSRSSLYWATSKTTTSPCLFLVAKTDSLARRKTSSTRIDNLK